MASPLQNLPTNAGAPGADEGRLAGRIPELDSLRGFAALGVLGLHVLYRYFHWAWSCVDLFFILSAFLITTILLNHRDDARMLPGFYARRALRIWPVYFLTFAVVTALWLVVGWLREGGIVALPDGHWLGLVFLQYTDRYFSGPELSYVWYFSHSWSLAVEEQFYVLWPLLFFLLRPRLGWLVPLFALALGAAIAARANGLSPYVLLTRVDGLMFGILLAYLAADRNSILWRAAPWWFAFLAAVALALLLPLLASRGTQNLLGLAPDRAFEVTAFCLLFACVVGAAVRWSGAPFLAWLRARPLVHLGRRSYGIYMYQVPVTYVLLEAVAAGFLTRTVAYGLSVVLTLLAAELSYRLFERRVLALKNLFPYRRDQAGLPSTSTSFSGVAM